MDKAMLRSVPKMTYVPKPNNINKEVARLIENFKEAFNGTILDVGTGDGSFMEALYDAGAQKVIGIEPSECFLEGINRGLDIQHCRFEEYDGFADLVCFRESIYYIELNVVFSKLREILQLHGGLYIKCHSADSLYYWRKRKARWGEAKFKPTLGWMIAQLKNEDYRIKESGYFPCNVLQCLGVPSGGSFLGSIVGYRLSPIVQMLGRSDRFYIAASRLLPFPRGQNSLAEEF